MEYLFKKLQTKRKEEIELEKDNLTTLESNYKDRKNELDKTKHKLSHCYRLPRQFNTTRIVLSTNI